LKISCKDCDEIQKLNREGKEIYLISLGDASILIGACDKHAHKIKQALKIYEAIVKQLVHPDDFKLPRQKSVFIEG